jgi:hypothetical protein
MMLQMLYLLLIAIFYLTLEKLVQIKTDMPKLVLDWSTNRYTTTASKGRGIGNFMKKVELPHEQVLEIIGVDTGPFQVSLQSHPNDYFTKRP